MSYNRDMSFHVDQINGQSFNVIKGGEVDIKIASAEKPFTLFGAEYGGGIYIPKEYVEKKLSDISGSLNLLMGDKIIIGRVTITGT